jgi:hypothetical protein
VYARPATCQERQQRGRTFITSAHMARILVHGRRPKMERWFRTGALGLVLALMIVPLGHAGGRTEQGRAYGPGMMGGGARGGYGPGMMGGGWGGYGRGMMGGSYGSGSAPQRVIDIAKARDLVTDYLAARQDKNLVIDEVMEFENNLYVLIKESDTGKGAFELLVDPFTGAVRPEFGPNMMWNTRYGMMSWQAGSSRATTIGKEEAKKIAADYLEKARGHGPYELEADELYGYYTVDVRKDGTLLGMLSVNAYTGQVWYHTWHGGFIAMQEGASPR